MITKLKDIVTLVLKDPNSLNTVQGTQTEQNTLAAELLAATITTPVVFYNTTLNSYYYWNGAKFINGAGLFIKSGFAANGDFSGNPKKATITFTTPFLNNDYSIVVTGETTSNFSYDFSIESKTNISFVINAGTNNITNLINALWIATENGEN